MARQTFDQEKAAFSLAKLKREGQSFEVAIDPDLAIEMKKGKEIDIKEVLKSEHVFFDAKKGDLASETIMKSVFGTTDPLAVAKKIIEEGEIQLTSEYRERLRTEKKNRIIQIIHQNAVDPKTDLPHPVQRLENAFAEAKVHIDEMKNAEDQVEDVIKHLRPILPLKFETRHLQIHIPSQHAAKMYGTVQSYAKILKEAWQNDGSWLAEVELPAGRQADFLDELNNKTHSEIETKEIKR